MEFINRKQDLEYLNALWKEDKPNLVVVYGKRRVGKTALVKQFIKNKNAVYYLADRVTEIENLKMLSHKIGSHFNDKFVLERNFSDWYQMFEYLKNKNEKMIFVVDEYPYLVETNKGVSSVFQKGWDEYFSDSKIMLILSGSSIGMMETETLEHKAPLYGRRSGQILVKPLTFYQSREFFPGMKFTDFLAFETITGGMPAYLLQFDKNKSLIENLKQKVFIPQTFLFNEVELIVREELREPRTYMSILRAIAYGKRKFGEIVNDTGLQKNIIMKYLHTLEDLYLIKKEVPITEKNSYLTKRGLYKLCDRFFVFWFKYIYPYKSELEMGQVDVVINKFKETFTSLAAENYEQVAKEILFKESPRIFNISKAGRWWDNNDEIDIVALNEDENKILFAEVKYSSNPVGLDIYNNLKRKAAAVVWGRENRKEYFCLFSKSGFTAQMKKIAEAEKAILIEGDSLLK